MILTHDDHIGYSGKDNSKKINGATIPDRESNTRSDLVRRFDWMTWVGKSVDKSVIERLLDKYFGDEYEVKDYAKGTYRGDKPYDHEFKSANGSILNVKEIKQEVAYDDIEVVLEESKYEIILSLSGRPLAVHYQDNDLVTPLLDFMELTEMGLHPSRIDLKFIDYRKVLNFNKLEEAGINGNFRGVKRHKSDKPMKLGKNNPNSKKLSPILAGNTQNFGSRGSNHFYRFYMEKYIHERDSFAYELELKGKKAQKAIDLFMAEYYLATNRLKLEKEEILDKLIQLFNNIFIGAIDFIDRTKQCPYTGSLKQCERLSFWQEFINYIQAKTKIKLSVAKPKATLNTTWNWLKRQAKGFINILKKGSEQIGVDYKILIDYLTVKDDEKMIYKPVIIQQDIGLKISELAVDGLSAIMTQDEINEFTDFAIASMYG